MSVNRWDAPYGEEQTFLAERAKGAYTRSGLSLKNGRMHFDMAVLPLTEGADNKILRTKSAEIPKIDRKIKALIRDMTDTMYVANGIGIAAPQVGVNLRLFIARLNHDTDHELIIPMMNPLILEKSEETEDGEEGCLSIPKRFGIVPRAKWVIIQFTDQKGQKQTLRLEGLNAKIIQHETDHIDAHLFIDRMKREVLQKKG